VVCPGRQVQVEDVDTMSMGIGRVGEVAGKKQSRWPARMQIEGGM
jgi:hypothetical protein